MLSVASTNTADITLFTPRNPGLFLLPQIYVPGVSPSVNSSGNTIGNIIPVVGSLVIDVTNNNTLYVVDAVDSNTHASTLNPAQMEVSNTNPDDSLVSIISYGNDIFRVYYDTRTSPITTRPDSRIVVFGTDNVNYQIVINPGSSQTVISQNYNSAGAYTGPLVPMAALTNASGTTIEGAMWCTPCYVNTTLTDGEELFIQVFNSQGAMTAQISAFAKLSVIVNELDFVIPTISSIAITSTQNRGNNEIYIYQNQNVDSLGIQIILTFTDGHQTTVPIDNTQCFLYGTEDFVASYPGLQQNILVKYFLSSDETATNSLLSEGRNFVTGEVSLIVVPNQLTTGVKISTIPRWNSSTSAYDLFFYLYSVSRNTVVNVTGMVTIDTSTPYNGSLYGVAQNLTLTLDMSQVDPTTYTQSTTYQQTLVITLQPIAALVRYILADATNAAVVFGADSTNNRRPILNFSTSGNQYVISSIFANQAAFLLSFYTDGNPPYDVSNETSAPVPTHFQLRDPSSGLAITTAPIPLASYNTPFNITGTGLQNRYAGTGSTVLVEFLTIVSGSATLINYGTPCDVYTVA